MEKHKQYRNNRVFYPENIVNIYKYYYKKYPYMHCVLYFYDIHKAFDFAKEYCTAKELQEKLHYAHATIKLKYQKHAVYLNKTRVFYPRSLLGDGKNE